MFDTEDKYTFKGTFEDNCQQMSVPQSLKTLVGMTLDGPNLSTQSSNSIETQAALTIAQLVHFNSTRRHRSKSTSG